MELETRAAAHAALGDPRRLAIVDQLAVGDLTVAELGDVVGMKGNLLAHHLDVLEAASLIERRVSEGDRRRRYISLRWEQVPPPPGSRLDRVGSVAFVCTRNSARSQFAAALWNETTRLEATSAGSDPAEQVHPTAVRVAAELGIDLSGARPAGYERITSPPDLVVSVCDRARESGVPEGRTHLHWSVPDPVTTGTVRSFRDSFGELAERVARLAAGSTDEGR